MQGGKGCLIQLAKDISVQILAKWRIRRWAGHLLSPTAGSSLIFLTHSNKRKSEENKRRKKEKERNGRKK